MKTEKQIRQEQLFQAKELAYRYYESEGEFVVSEHDTPLVFFTAVLFTLQGILVMKESNSISKRIKEQFSKALQDVINECCGNFIEDGDESHLVAGMMTFAVMTGDIRAMLKQEVVE